MAQEILWKSELAPSLAEAKTKKKYVFLEFNHAPQ